MDSDSDSGTLGAITAVSRAFEDALTRLQGWRKSRKNRRSGESELQDSLEAGKDDLKTEYYKLRDEHGDEFEQGDEISRSSLFKIANDIQRTLVDVIAKAELVHGYNIPDLNPSDLWQKSEKIRKSAALCMGELVRRMKTRKANRSSYIDSRAGSQGSINSPSMHPNPPIKNAPTFQTQTYGFDAPLNVFYPPAARYSTNSFPLYTQPEYTQPQYDEPEYDEPEYVEPQTSWRMPWQPTPPRHQSPQPQQTYQQGLPTSLRIGVSAGGSPPPVQRQRPASVSMTGTGYISRVGTATPFSEPLVQKPFSSTPLTRPGVQERNPYGYGQQERGQPDARRATVGYTKPPHFDADVVSRVWSPEPPPKEKPWVPRGALYSSISPPREQAWIPKGALYSPISPPEDFLDVTAHGHFRMPTPVNHGGQEFHQQ